MAVRVFKRSQQAVGGVGHFVAFACGIGGFGKIAVAVQCEGGALAERCDDGGGIAQGIAFDLGDQTVAVSDPT